MLSPLCTRGAFSLPRCIEWAFSEPLCQDCTLAASGGAGAPRVTAHTAFSEFWVQRHAGSGHRTAAALGPVSGQSYRASALGKRTRNKAKKDLPLGRSFLLCTWQGLHAGPYRCWLASTGAQEQTAHTAFSEFWPSGRPDFSKCVQYVILFFSGEIPRKKYRCIGG